jgi:hypothetical protein
MRLANGLLKPAGNEYQQGKNNGQTADSQCCIRILAVHQFSIFENLKLSK